MSLYLLAVACEWLDHEIHALTWLISDHTLKHLLIALSIAWLVRMLALRKPIEVHHLPDNTLSRMLENKKALNIFSALADIRHEQT